MVVIRGIEVIKEKYINQLKSFVLGQHLTTGDTNRLLELVDTDNLSILSILKNGALMLNEGSRYLAMIVNNTVVMDQVCCDWWIIHIKRLIRNFYYDWKDHSVVGKRPVDYLRIMAIIDSGTYNVLQIAKTFKISSAVVKQLRDYVERMQ